jgi:hypothetical protein
MLPYKGGKVCLYSVVGIVGSLVGIGVTTHCIGFKYVKVI